MVNDDQVRPDDDGTDEGGTDEDQDLSVEGSTGTAGSAEPAQPPPMAEPPQPAEDQPGRRRPASGALRLAAGLAAGGAMVWAASALDTSWGADPGRGEDAGTTSAPAEPDPFVRSVSLVCPGWPADEDDAVPTPGVRAATAPDVLRAPEDVGDGATLSAADGGPAVRFPAGGAPDGLDADGWTLAAAGPDAAPGLVAAQLVAAPDPGSRGMAFTPCQEPAETQHLVGGGPGAGRVERVVVTNPGADPVRVALEVSGVDGPAEVDGGRGLVVPPRGRTTYLLDALAPDVKSPVVTVVAEGGPVGAHLVERASQGTVDLGVEVVPAAAEPARDLVLPALPGPVGEGGERSVTVRLFAPEDEAVVELRALTTEGARVPSSPVVRVPAGATVDVGLADLADDVHALLLRSDAPVTAAARLTLAPASDEPVVVEDDAASTATPGDDAASTAAVPDGTGATAAPGDAATAATAGPDGAATTAGPDSTASTAGPDRAGATATPGGGTPSGPRVVRPAGEAAWVTAVALTDAPVGTALPDLGDRSPTVSLAVSAVDATGARILWMDAAGEVRTEDLDLANDTTQVVEVPTGTTAVWVSPTGAAGVVAALHLTDADPVGPYLAAGTLPPVPWTVPVLEVRPVVP